MQCLCLALWLRGFLTLFINLTLPLFVTLHPSVLFSASYKTTIVYNFPFTRHVFNAYADFAQSDKITCHLDLSMVMCISWKYYTCYK